MKKYILLFIAVTFLTACPFSKLTTSKGRLVMFIGVDISGSFMPKKYFSDSLKFLSHYIYAHLHGYGGLEKPYSLFVGSIGGAHANEPKTFYPIQSFQNRSIKEIEIKLREIFPRKIQNQFTDYNAFFKQIAVTVRNKKLMLKPISIIMITDGKPDAPVKGGRSNYRIIKVKALENLARDITLRVLYTSAPVGINWQTKIPRQRVKIWTQDANVMTDWKDPHILLRKTAFKNQKRFFSWVKDNIDFRVAKKRVN